MMVPLKNRVSCLLIHDRLLLNINCLRINMGF